MVAKGLWTVALASIFWWAEGWSAKSSLQQLQRRTFLATWVALPAYAYTPDPNPLQESLYFISRVQEATVQQERLIGKLGGTPQLRSKLKLTLRLIDKNYKLLDQINYSSKYIRADQLIEASEAGYEAVEALQATIDFVQNDDNWTLNVAEDSRAQFLVQSLQTCRRQLLVYTDSMPSNELRNARFRVEDENVKNRVEFDGDESAGVYNPVNIPWTPISSNVKEGAKENQSR